MTVSIERFSEIAGNRDVAGTGFIAVDTAQDVKLVKSRFRFVRWIRDSGIGRRRRNRETVDSFIRSLEGHYGREVTSRMDLRRLRAVHDHGKPLRVRHVRAAIVEADMVADGVRMVRSSNIPRLIEENVADAAYASLPGGEELVQELLDRVDVGRVGKELADRQVYMHGRRGKFDGDYSLGTARRLVSLAVGDASRDLFLSGYGIGADRGLECDKLQGVFDRHPAAKALKEKYGVALSASRASGALFRTLSEKLPDRLHRSMEMPGSLSGEGPIAQRIERALDEVAERVVGNFIQERSVALDRLYDLYGSGEIQADDMLVFEEDRAFSLSDVVLHNRIPPEKMTTLYELRSRMPDEISKLASPNCSLEQKVRVLAQFGDIMGEIFRGLSDVERKEYAFGPDGKLSFMHDCGRFLLEGKLSFDAESEIRTAASERVSQSGLPELLDGISAMRGAMYGPGSNAAHWAAVGDRLDDMAMASVALLAPYVPEVIGPYTPGAGKVVNAMRNCGFEVPPPGNPGVEQSGSGAFSQAARDIAEQEMNEDLSLESQVESTRYPGFLAEAVTDYNRAQYTVGGTRIEWGDTDAVVAGIRNICTDGNNRTDWALCKIVSQLVYQRADSMAIRRTAFGSGAEDDTFELLRTVPFAGMLVFTNDRSGYDISRKPDGNVLVHIKSGGVGKRLDFFGVEPQLLDQDQSRVAFDVYVEVDAGSHSARVVDMTHQFRLVPTAEEP